MTWLCVHCGGETTGPARFPTPCGHCGNVAITNSPNIATSRAHTRETQPTGEYRRVRAVINHTTSTVDPDEHARLIATVAQQGKERGPVAWR